MKTITDELIQQHGLTPEEYQHILDMLGRIARKPIGQLIGEIHNPTVAVYRANGERDVTAEAVMVNLTRQVEESQARALKIKIGGRMSHAEYPAGRSE